MKDDIENIAKTLLSDPNITQQAQRVLKDPNIVAATEKIMKNMSPSLDTSNIKTATQNAIKGVSGGKIDTSTAIQAMTAKATHGIVSFGKKVLNLVKIATALKDTVNGLRMFIVSLVVIMICIGIFALIYYIARVLRVRIIQPGHTESFGGFMKEFHDDVNTTRKLMTSISTFKGMYDLGNSQNLIDMMECGPVIDYFNSMNSGIQNIVIDSYFKYKDIYGGMSFKYYEKDVQAIKDDLCRQPNIHRFHQQANPNMANSSCDTAVKPEDYLNLIILKPFDRIRDILKTNVGHHKKVAFINRIMTSCASVSQTEYQKEKPQVSPQTSRDPNVIANAQAFVIQCKQKGVGYSDFTTYLTKMIDMTIGLELLHLYMNIYYDEIKQLHNNRRFGFFNLLVMMIEPYVKTLIVDNVQKNWRDLFSQKGRERNYQEFLKSWGKIGDSLKNLPKKLARTNENFDETNHPKEPIIEGFGFLKGLLAIGDFFMAILDVARGLSQLITRPLDMLFAIFKMIIGLVIGLFLLIIYALLSLPPFIYIVYGIYFFIVHIVINAIFSAFWILLFATFAIISGVIWTIDLMLSAMTGFKSHSFLVWFVRCENLPDIWYTRANHVEGNVFQRSFSCQRPCAPRFVPDGLTCKGIYEQQPSYCPQAQVYRIYKGMDVGTSGGPYHMGEFKPSLKFYTKSKEDKEKEVREYFEKRQRFYEKCHQTTKPYHDITKAICANYDKIKLTDEKLRPYLATVCRQAFCEKNNKEEFCYKFANASKDPQKAKINAPMESDEILTKIVTMCIMIIVIMIILLMFVYGGNQDSTE
jgi:hypothetical protein